MILSILSLDCARCTREGGNMNRPEFSEQELTITGRLEPDVSINRILKSAGMPELPGEPIYDRPISVTDNFNLLMHGEKPMWMPQVGYVYSNTLAFSPREVPDNYCEHTIHDATNDLPDYDSNTQKSSWFDLEWVYVPAAGGATVKPGEPKVPNITEWEKYVSSPDLNQIDWDSVMERNKDYFKIDKAGELHIMTGSWERLMCLMDVDSAAIALIDEDEQDGIHSFLDMHTTLYCDYINKIKDMFDIQGVLVHDDWGHQNGPFFSTDTAREMLLPYLKRIIDTCHDRGLFYEQHSCGKNEAFIPMYIEAGVDLYCPQDINNFDEMLKMTKGSNLTIGLPMPIIKPGTPETDIRNMAADWFDRYKDDRVAMSFMMPNQIFVETVYELSRKYYAA